MAVALLSPGSHRAWTRARARAGHRAGRREPRRAKTWLRGGASPAGFPPPTPEEVCAGVYGGKPSRRSRFESVVRVLLVLFSSKSTRTWSPGLLVRLLAAALAAPAAAAAAAATENGKTAARVSPRSPPRSSPNAPFLYLAALWKTGKIDPGVAAASPRSGSRRARRSAIAPEKAFWSETSLIAAAAFAAGPGGASPGSRRGARGGGVGGVRGGGGGGDAAVRADRREGARRQGNRRGDVRDEGQSGVRPRRSHKRNHV